MDFSLLNDITNSKAAWVYLVFSLIGLYSSIFFTTVEEKRFPKLWDLYLLTGSLPFVWGAALLADVSPWVSLAIGIASERVYSVIRKRGLSFTFGVNNKLMLGEGEFDDDDDDDDKEEEDIEVNEETTPKKGQPPKVVRPEKRATHETGGAAVKEKVVPTKKRVVPIEPVRKSDTPLLDVDEKDEEDVEESL